jgi:excisionase family DNA binding protein
MIKKEPRYLTPKQAADYLGLSPKTLEKWRAAGTEGPPFIKMGAKAVRYDMAELDLWVKSRSRHSTSEV